MIEVGVVDLSAEGRRRLTAIVERWAWVSPDSRNVSVPRLSIRPLAPEEVRYHGSLDVCLFGPEIAASDAAQCAALRRQLPGKVLISVIDAANYSLGLVEQLSRLGIDDIIIDTASSDEFYRRIVLLTRKVKRSQIGSICTVQSSRGGVGVSFMASGYAEALLASGRSVCLVDTDVESQDLARFLQCRPHVSEPLKLLLEQQRTITTETVKEALIPVWNDTEGFLFLPSPANSDHSWFASSKVLRSFLNVIECIASVVEVVVIDTSRMPASAKLLLSQISNEVIFVMNRDVAGAYSFRNALTLLSGVMKADASLVLSFNNTGKGALTPELVRTEILNGIEKVSSLIEFSYSKRASKWICSGATPAQFIVKQFKILASAHVSLREQKTESREQHSEQGRNLIDKTDNSVLQKCAEYFSNTLAKYAPPSKLKGKQDSLGNVSLSEGNSQLSDKITAPRLLPPPELSEMVSGAIVTDELTEPSSKDLSMQSLELEEYVSSSALVSTQENQIRHQRVTVESQQVND